MKVCGAANYSLLLILELFLLIIGLEKIATKKLYPLRLTPLGKIQGTYKESFIGKKYEAYEGIPYAMPPTKELRFEPPQPVVKWKNVLNATKPSSPCVQYSHGPLNYPVRGDEDCLYLNIYAPLKARSLPVLFAIHGGAFQFGESSNGAKYLMDEDVILVSINYRLGPFGFLSTEDDIVPGNMGLKDQSMALQWVSKNIKYFGGDPKKVTLIGISAGGASVHYHYLSPMSKGLFQNSISFSGSALGPGKHTENSLEKSKKLANLMDCPTESIPRMISCLKSVPAPLIANATSHFMPWLYNPFTPFGPVVEETENNPFVNRSAIEIISSGDAADVLWISSTVTEEGLYPAAEFIGNAELMEELDANWEQIAPHLLDYNYTIPLEKHAVVARKIRNHYFGSKPINRNTAKQLINLIGDRLYIFDAEKAARLQAQINKSPVLFLRYGYKALTSLSNFFSRSNTSYGKYAYMLDGWNSHLFVFNDNLLNQITITFTMCFEGVPHADDYNMLFENNFIDPLRRAVDRAMQVKLIKYVVSVATTGLPDLALELDWNPIDPSQEATDFLFVSGPSDIRMASDDNIGEKKFWSTIDFDENKLD